MNNKKTLIIILLVIILMLGFASVLYRQMGENTAAQQFPDVKTDEDSEQNGEEEKLRAFDFTVYDSQGNAVGLSQFTGKPIVLNFWASWCGPCRSHMPVFDEAYKKYGEDVNFVMINVTDGSTETVETATEYINEKGYSFPVYFDRDLDAGAKYSAYSIPTTYFIDAEGYIYGRTVGALNMETLEMAINEILK